MRWRGALMFRSTGTRRCTPSAKAHTIRYVVARDSPRMAAAAHQRELGFSRGFLRTDLVRGFEDSEDDLDGALMFAGQMNVQIVGGLL